MNDYYYVSPYKGITRTKTSSTLSSPFQKSHKSMYKSKKSTFHPSKSTNDIHNITKGNGLRSMRVLLHNLGNCRYLGLSEFHSEHSLQHSSYIWSFTRTARFKYKHSLINNNIYNIKPLLSNKSSSFPRAKRTTLKQRVMEMTPSPQEYKCKGTIEDNLSKQKGIIFKQPNPILKKKGRNNRTPGPGDYNLSKDNLFFQNPITIKSRNCFYHEEDLRKKSHIVSMQRYTPSMKLIESGRFKKISFGYGNKVSIGNKSVEFYPGPGTYDIPGTFERGIKKKPALN